MGTSSKRFRSVPAWARDTFVAAALTCLGFVTAAAAAESESDKVTSSLFDSEYTVAFGGYFPYVNSDLKLGSSSGSGTTVDFESDLGLDQYAASAWLAFNWRYEPRHRVHIEWFQLNRSGTDTLSATETIGGAVFFVGVQVDTSFDLNIGRASYAYSFILDERNDLSFVAGLHVATARASVTGTGLISVDGEPIFDQTHTESSDSITFPLPHIGFSYTRLLTPRLTANVTALAFALEVNDLSGYLFELDGTVGYNLTDNFGIGGGVKYYNVNITDSDLSGDTRFNMQFVGPTIFVYGTF